MIISNNHQKLAEVLSSHSTNILPAVPATVTLNIHVIMSVEPPLWKNCGCATGE